jgi:phage terminase large subunit-like protein
MKVLSKMGWENLENKGEVLNLQPKQKELYECDADIAFFVGGAGSGKTVAELAVAAHLESIKNPLYAAVIFRRLCTQITKPGGLLDESRRWYKALFGKLNTTRMEWQFKSGAKVAFAHLQHLKDMYTWQGVNITLIVFDELTHFLEEQFWYLFSRVRSTSGVKTKLRGTCNPDADSWVAPLVRWYIDDDGYPIPERLGIKRYFIRVDNNLIWGDTPEELQSEFPDEVPISFAVFSANLSDNPALMESDPSYKGKLQALTSVERGRLLDGNWKVRRSETQLFDPLLIPPRCDGKWSEPEYGHNYLIGVDPNFGSQGGDYFVCQCYDITLPPYRLVHEYRSNRNSIKYSIQKCEKIIKDYNPVLVAVEKNAGGQSVVEELISRSPGTLIKPVVTWQNSKVVMTDRIAIALESGNIAFPPDWEGINELYNFSKITREATTGHDDCVMAWAIAYAYLDEAIELCQISPLLIP